MIRYDEQQKRTIKHQLVEMKKARSPKWIYFLSDDVAKKLEEKNDKTITEQYLATAKQIKELKELINRVIADKESITPKMLERYNKLVSESHESINSLLSQVEN